MLNAIYVHQSFLMRREGLENLIFTAQTEGKKLRGKQRLIYLVGLSKWMTEQGLGGLTKKQNLLRDTKYRVLP